MSQTQQAMALLIDVFHQYSGKEGNPLSLSKGELKDLLKNEFGDLLGKANDQAAMDRVFNALDADKDNSVDFNEYINLTAKCEYQDRVFGMGESWVTAKCDQCVCLEPFGVGCCEHGPQPVDYPDRCEVVRKPDSRSIAVVMRVNHKFPCLYGGRGRMRPSWKSDIDPLY